MARLLDGGEVRSVWERLNDTPVAALSGFLQAEHPQTAAVILSEMRAEVAASVLERLDRASPRRWCCGCRGSRRWTR